MVAGGVAAAVVDAMDDMNLSYPKVSDAQKKDLAYTTTVMNDVHMSHAMEFPYPQSMSNCVTCHGDNAASMTTYSHAAHLNTTTGGGGLLPGMKGPPESCPPAAPSTSSAASTRSAPVSSAP